MDNKKSDLENKNINELNDSDLDKVSGGGNLTLNFFDTAEQVRFIFYVGDIVKVKETIFSSTVQCRIVGREVFYDPQYHCYEDAYLVRGTDCDFYTRVLRDDIVNEID